MAAAPRGRRRAERAAAALADGPIETSLGRDEYIHAVEVAKDAIAAGEAIQVVLARRQSFDLPIDPATGAARSTGSRCTGRSGGSTRARTCSSSGRRRSRSSAPRPSSCSRSRATGSRRTRSPGTRPAAPMPAEDELLAEQLQRDPKERAEHVMLVDLGRNDLGRVARPGTVTVSKYMEVERYSHVLHLVSHVEGRLEPELDALDALRSVFPAGTLSGAPKVRAMQLIAAAEGERRGLYGGAVGYLGYDGNLDTAITIRSAVLKRRPGPRPHRRRDRRRLRPGDGVRGDRAQGRGPAPGDRAGGRRPRRRARIGRATRARPTAARGPGDPR